LNYIGEPQRWIPVKLGHEDFCFPASRHILELPPKQPDVLHCHNLHGDYFDLRALPWLSRKIPVVLTLHDAWLLSGHCAHSFDCDRWKTGCRQCLDLTILPPIQRDAAAYNWRRKQKIHANSKLYVAAPSKWLMHKVEQSILKNAMIEGRIIPNGVDLSVFHPADKQAVRKELGIAGDARVLFFTANTIRQNLWKDYQTMQAAVAFIAERFNDQRTIFVALGEVGPKDQIGRAHIRFVPYQNDPSAVARYYQVADVYIHATRADTFPNTVLEALACGTPVVATAVGGIPEQMEDGHTGFLVPPGDAVKMATSIQKLLENDTLRHNMSIQAATVARQRFDLERMVYEYLEWYQKILQTFPRHLL
jgi:glycosyltransferase involved in cell wall biosynthesis